MLRVMSSVVVAASLAGCAASPPPPPAAAAPVAAEPTLSGLLTGALGQGLTDADRQAAFAAQVAALDSGQRKTWRGGPKGAFGYVEPGAEQTRAEGACRDYAVTIYVAGRPRNGKGLACRDAATRWRFVS